MFREFSKRGSPGSNGQTKSQITDEAARAEARTLNMVLLCTNPLCVARHQILDVLDADVRVVRKPLGILSAHYFPFRLDSLSGLE